MQRCVKIAKNSVKYFRRFKVMDKRTLTFLFIQIYIHIYVFCFGEFSLLSVCIKLYCEWSTRTAWGINEYRTLEHNHFDSPVTSFQGDTVYHYVPGDLTSWCIPSRRGAVPASYLHSMRPLTAEPRYTVQCGGCSESSILYFPKWTPHDVVASPTRQAGCGNIPVGLP
jgi:hypothetical protein